MAMIRVVLLALIACSSPASKPTCHVTSGAVRPGDRVRLFAPADCKANDPVGVELWCLRGPDFVEPCE